MNKTEHLLACVAEECGEVQQAVGKCLRFGILDTGPMTDKTNSAQLRNEIHDLIAVYQMLCDVLGESSELDVRVIDLKKDRVLKFMEHARQVGTLESEITGERESEGRKA